MILPEFCVSPPKYGLTEPFFKLPSLYSHMIARCRGDSNPVISNVGKTCPKNPKKALKIKAKGV